MIERFMESPRRRTALQIGADGAAWVLAIVAAALLRYDFDRSLTPRPATTLHTRGSRVSACKTIFVLGRS